MSLQKGGKKIKKMKSNRVRPVHKSINTDGKMLGEILKLLGDKRLHVRLENGKEAQAFFGNKFGKKGSQKTRFKVGDYLYLEEYNANESGTEKVYEVLTTVQLTKQKEAKDKIIMAHEGDEIETFIGSESETDSDDGEVCINIDKQKLKIAREENSKSRKVEQSKGRTFSDPSTLQIAPKDEPFDFDKI